MVASLSEDVHKRHGDQKEREHDVHDVRYEHPKTVDDGAEPEDFTERPVGREKPTGNERSRKEKHHYRFDKPVYDRGSSRGFVRSRRRSGSLSRLGRAGRSDSAFVCGIRAVYR